MLYTTIKLLGVPVTMKFPLFDSGHALGNLWFFAKVFSLTLAGTTLISTLTLRLVENPGIALGKRIIRRINAPTIAKPLPFPAGQDGSLDSLKISP